MTTPFPEDDFIFNVVFTPRTFRCLRYFLASLVVQSKVRFRIVANGCDADEILLMDRFMSMHATRVVEVLRLPVPRTVTHGEALTYAYDPRPSGKFFCFIDSDIKALRKWMDTLIGELAQCAAITSGTVAWGATYVAPAEARWLTGDDFFATDGFVFGSPHVALYERAAVDLVRGSWAVDFRGRPQSDLPVATQAAIRSLGRGYEMYDTAKLINILLQLEGRCVRYVENDHLLHLGGISEYLANPLTSLRGNAQHVLCSRTLDKGETDRKSVRPLPRS